MSSWSTPAISITGRRPGVTSLGTVASPSSSHTSVVIVRVYSVSAATMFLYSRAVSSAYQEPSGRCARLAIRQCSCKSGNPFLLS